MKKYLFIAATAAAALASCTEQVEFTQESLQNNAEAQVPVQFGTYLGNSAETRAAGTVDLSYDKGPIGNKDVDFVKHLARAGFGVFSYFTGATNYDPASGTGTWRTQATAEKYPNFMYNQKLQYYAANNTATTLDGYSGTGEYWTYDPVKYWPNGIDAANTASDPSNTAKQNAEAKLSFYAYSPFVETPTTDYNESWYGAIPSTISYAGYVKYTGKTNGIQAMTTNTYPGNVTLKYIMPKATANEAVDLLWGLSGTATYKETDASNATNTIGSTYNVNLTKQTVKEKIKFLFKHALTKIGGQMVATEDNKKAPEATDQCAFKVVLDIDGNNGDGQNPFLGSNFTNTKTLVTIKELKIRDAATVKTDGDVTGFTETTSNLYNSGWFNIETGTWSGVTQKGATVSIVANNTTENDANVTDANYSLNPAIKEIGIGSGKKELDSSDKSIWSTANPTGVTATAQPVFASENVPGLLLIPGTDKQTIYVTLEYYVRTADENLASGYTEVLQKITNQVDLSSLQPNKYYTIIMHIGLTSVKFEAVVADWATASDGTYDENGTFTPASGSTATEEKVWLPSNVVK